MPGPTQSTKRCYHCGSEFPDKPENYRSCCDACKKAGHEVVDNICRKCQELFETDSLQHYPNVGLRANNARRGSVLPLIKPPPAA